MTTPAETAAASLGAVKDLPAGFMLDMETYSTGGELGFAGMDFYTCGRGGALGDVSGDVVAASFVFMNPTQVCEQWDRGREVMAPSRAAMAFRDVAADWAEAHLGAEIDYERLGALARQIATSASPACAPLFAGWRAVEAPDSPKGAALHHLNVLRELRGALHAAAVVAAGLRPDEAAFVNDPVMAAMFGWGDPPEDLERLGTIWSQADDQGSAAFAAAFAPLTEAERDEFVDLASAAHGGIV